MKPKIVIIGAGLAGCYLASEIIDKFEVTIIEVADLDPLLRDRIVDLSLAAVTYPNIESGLGGSSRVWHNALMEIDANIFKKHWPYSKNILIPYYERAYSLLSGTTKEKIYQYANDLRVRLVNMGFPIFLLEQSMFIPKKRVNAWEATKIKDKVSLFEGEVFEMIPNENKNKLQKIEIKSKDGKIKSLEFDYFVLSAGGIGSPLLLQNFTQKISLPSLQNSGKNYEDHPMAFVGEVELNKPLYKLWDFPLKTKSGNANIRFPLALEINGLQISFQLRPAHHFRLSKPRSKVISIISNLRNFPFKLSNYWLLFKHIDDIFDILSFKFGLRIPTRHYSILMISEQTPALEKTIWKDEKESKIFRNWKIDKAYIDTINLAREKFLESINPLVVKSSNFEDWPNQIYSSSHHSGTARMSMDERFGVCDENAKVHGISNLYVCDGSIIPGSGFVNTGLTIVALALKLSDHLKENIFKLSGK